jgi:undecaprenyl pyrophosphate phosphatase UppP
MMARLILPDERKSRTALYFWSCFCLFTVPAFILGLLFRPLTQEHIGLGVAAVSAGGFAYWTCSNLLTGTFRSRQGNYERDVEPFRYWMNTVLIALGTILTISFLVHQSLVVVAVSRSVDSEPKLENKANMATPRKPSD